MASAYDYYLQNDSQRERDERGNMMAIPAAAGLFAALYTPLLPNMAKGLWRTGLNVTKWTGEAAMDIGGKAAGKAGAYGAKFAGREAALARLNLMRLGRAKRWAMGAATDLGRGSMKYAEFATRHAAGIGASIIGGAMIYGALKGVFNPVTEGPENRTVYDESMGMPADNLGATGDLTLALHHRRRR